MRRAGVMHSVREHRMPPEGITEAGAVHDLSYVIGNAVVSCGATRPFVHARSKTVSTNSRARDRRRCTGAL